MTHLEPDRLKRNLKTRSAPYEHLHISRVILEVYIDTRVIPVVHLPSEDLEWRYPPIP